MATISDNALDQALSYIRTNAGRMDICSQEPSTYAQATSTYTLGNTTTVSLGASGPRSGGGREATLAAITDGTVSGTGTATHFALTDGTGELLYAQSLNGSQAVTSGNVWTLTAHVVGITDPA